LKTNSQWPSSFDPDSSRELIDKIKGALSGDISSPDDAVELADATTAR